MKFVLLQLIAPILSTQNTTCTRCRKEHRASVILCDSVMGFFYCFAMSKVSHVWRQIWEIQTSNTSTTTKHFGTCTRLSCNDPIAASSAVKSFHQH